MNEKLKQDTLYKLNEEVCNIAVCAPAEWDAEKVQAETNANSRPGTSANEWVIAPEAPVVPCHLDGTRKHWILVC